MEICGPLFSETGCSVCERCKAEVLLAEAEAKVRAVGWVNDQNPKLITINMIQGQLAHYAVVQHPFKRPDGIFDVIEILGKAALKWEGVIPDLPMKRFADWRGIEAWLREALQEPTTFPKWAWSTLRFSAINSTNCLPSYLSQSMGRLFAGQSAARDGGEK